MRNYEKPMAIKVALTSDVILTSPIITLQEGGSPSITELKSFNWNE